LGKTIKHGRNLQLNSNLQAVVCVNTVLWSHMQTLLQQPLQSLLFSRAISPHQPRPWPLKHGMFRRSFMTSLFRQDNGRTTS